jgi:hypothetical protein
MKTRHCCSSLGTTHEIEVEGDDYAEAEQLGGFIVTVLGFLYGVLLTLGSWVNFYRVCVNRIGGGGGS